LVEAEVGEGLFVKKGVEVDVGDDEDDEDNEDDIVVVGDQPQHLSRRQLRTID